MMSDDRTALYEDGLRRDLTAGQLTMIAIGSAIGTGLFLGSKFAISTAGPAVLVSYVVGALLSLLLMGALTELTIAQPTAGSFGVMAERHLGGLTGFIVRYIYLIGMIIGVGTEVTAVAIYMSFWMPGVPGAWWIGLFSTALVLINAGGVRIFGSTEYLLSAIKLCAIVAFLLLGTWLLVSAPAGSPYGFHNYTASGGFAPNGLSGIWVAVIVALFSYLGIEMIAVAAGEAADPKRAVVRAFRLTIFRLITFYVASLAIMLALVPWHEASDGGSPFVTVMASTGIPGAASIINAVVLIAALSAMNSQIYVATRMLFSLSRAGLAPAAFGRLSRAGVPLASLGASSVGAGFAAILYTLAPEETFPVLISAATFAGMVTWLTIFVTHIAFRRGSPVLTGFKMKWAPATSYAGAALMIALMITTAFTEAFRSTLIVGLPLLVLLATAYWWRSMRMRPAPSS